MPRLLRCQLEPHLFVEVTARCLGGQLLLRPSKLVNDLIAGVLALAEEHYDVEVVAFVALSNHFHALLIPADGRELSRFMQYVKSNIARELNRVLQRTGPFWERRYTATWIPYSPAKMEARFRYLLSQGVKENLVARVVQWPGIHFGRNVINSMPITGVSIAPKRGSCADRARNPPRPRSSGKPVSSSRRCRVGRTSPPKSAGRRPSR